MTWPNKAVFLDRYKILEEVVDGVRDRCAIRRVLDVFSIRRGTVSEPVRFQGVTAKCGAENLMVIGPKFAKGRETRFNHKTRRSQVINKSSKFRVSNKEKKLENGSCKKEEFF